MDYKNINDYELLYLVKEKDEDAINLVFKKYEPLLFKIASKYYKKYKYTGISFEDLVQESRVGLMNAVNCFDDEQSMFYSFALLCIERQLINYTKTYNNLKNYPLNCGSVALVKDEMFSDNCRIDEILLENEKFFECKNILKFKLSIVYELRYNGFSFKEIAALLDLPITTIDGRISMVRKTLKNNLNINF